jgi:hypothetical protein
MAPYLHSAAQVPHPEQAAVVTLATCFLAHWMALKGHTRLHRLHFLQRSGSTTAVIASTANLLLFSRIPAREAVALACVTLSLTS